MARRGQATTSLYLSQWLLPSSRRHNVSDSLTPRLTTEIIDKHTVDPIAWSCLSHKAMLLKFNDKYAEVMLLTHWGRVTHICVSKLTIIGSDNGLSPDRRQAIIWTNAGILLIGPYGTNFSEILIEILTFSFTKMSLKVSSAKWRLFYLGLNVLTINELALMHAITQASFIYDCMQNNNSFVEIWETR